MQDGKTVTEQNVWEHYKRVEAENFHLKKQLVNKNRQINQLKRVISQWKSKYEKLMENRKPKYKNTIRRK
ncbi:hypothetical protein FJQ98_15900 [Lysinibacillus agricola]|uniref:Transposase n=1 Tax=Lysinibacillus agricola TaxID=2590012 RepID=A0ABX7AP88_9BACI|nr:MULTISPECIES: hypothetical protein [Lysinibacillus]KOS61569.1 hypothetical protein AN161_18455 [Lysinibacillus sp. FJAT-14222]QQP10728.1 hypothetical protein FJQ98_15900 [Lysinibacillus agricola]